MLKYIGVMRIFVGQYVLSNLYIFRNEMDEAEEKTGYATTLYYNLNVEIITILYYRWMTL